MQNTRLLLFLMITLSFACQRNTTNLLQQATQLHTEATTIDYKIKASIADLIQESSSIQIQGRALTEAEMSRVKAINKIQESYGWYQDNFIDPSTETDLNPKQMLERQRALRDAILAIQQEIERL